jgi:hypothetical protein
MGKGSTGKGSTAKRKQQPKEPVEEPKKVFCPVHGNALLIQRDGDREYAVCNCQESGNRWSGKIVWERIV